MVSFSLRLRISYLLLQDSSLVSFHLIQFGIQQGSGILFLNMLSPAIVG